MAMQRNYFTVLFFLKKSKLLKNGEAPICMRITINGKRAEIQIKRGIDVAKWNAQKECAIGKERKYQEINHYLDTIRTKILQIHRELEQDGKPITADIIKNIYYGGHSTPKMLLEVFQEHNLEYRELMNKEYAEGTVLRYERTARYLKEFISEQYNLTDIPLKSINYEFITKFEHFIKIQKNCAQNATVKYLKNLKKIIKTALIKKWITDDPFAEIHFKQTKCNREFLNETEIRKIINKDFDIQRLQTVRDIFIFCCFTGLAFTDVKNLKKEHLVQADNGEWWIRKAREKTDNMCDIPLLDIPRLILEKYQSNPICNEKGLLLPVPSNQRMNSYLKEIADVGLLLPVPSNQRMNSYLKEIADVCGIQKNLSTHIARHTFASLAIANKVSLESIAKMLGHTDIRTTRIYAKIMNSTIANEMKVLQNKFAI